jgi:hypothetical protein
VPGGFTADPDVLDTWATSSLTPQLLGGWSRDEDFFDKVFPFDLRPQGTRHHPHLAVLDRGPGELTQRLGTVEACRTVRLDPRS